METLKFTTASTEEILHKVNIYRELKVQLSGLNISEYTNAFTNLLIIFQAFPKNDPARKVETFKKMRRSTKTLELYLVLDYHRIMQGSDEENLKHIKEVFLSGCEIFLKDMKGFDWLAGREAILKVIGKR